MMKRLFTRVRALSVLGLLVVASVPASVSANPFGQGVFGADVPFGTATNISVALGGNPTLSLTPNGGYLEGTGSHTLTVTSTDVVGYYLYLYSPTSSTMYSGSDSIPASSNTSAAALATDTWGYNTTGSTTNFIGLTTTPVLLKTANGPYKNGDNTTVTYGVKVSTVKGAGVYTADVVYTVAGRSQ